MALTYNSNTIYVSCKEINHQYPNKQYNENKNHSIFFRYPRQFASVTQSSLTLISWTAACQASLSITSSPSLFKPMSIKLVMPFNQLILCCPLSLPSISPSSRVFSSSSHQVYKVLKLQHQSFQSIFRADFL